MVNYDEVNDERIFICCPPVVIVKVIYIYVFDNQDLLHYNRRDSRWN